jgi:hypothetical protein
MRNLYVCGECATSYLPPESMEYPTGPASPVHCSVCQQQLAERGVTASPEAVAAALLLARRAQRSPVDEQRRPDVRPTRPARTRRAPAPGGRRSKLV